MKIGVISDTHLKNYDKRLEKIIEKYFADVDLIFHAGDIIDVRVLDVFRGKDVYAVCGNMDLSSVRTAFPEKLTLDVEGHKIGLIHGWGTPSGIESKIIGEFQGIDCLVYGHTHKAVNREQDGVLFFNPGSPTDRIFARRNTLGIIEVGETITGEIIDIEN